MMAGSAAAVVAPVLERVAASAAQDHAALAQELRAAFPECHFSVCGEDDVSPRLAPAAANAACLLYYVARGEHCLSFTSDAAAATGLVVALRGEDD